MNKFLAEARKQMLDCGMNYGHPEVIQELVDLYNKGITESTEAVSKLSEIAHSMDDRDYLWMNELYGENYVKESA